MASVSKTIIPKFPDQKAFAKFWNQVQSARKTSRLGYGVVSPSKTEDHYVICPQINSDGLGLLETLEGILDYKIQSRGSGIIPYVPKGSGYGIDTQWTITLALQFDPSTPSLSLFTNDNYFTLNIHNKTGDQVWKQIEQGLEVDLKPFPFDEKRLSWMPNQQNIFVVELLEETWAAINNQVVLP